MGMSMGERDKRNQTVGLDTIARVQGEACDLCASCGFIVLLSNLGIETNDCSDFRNQASCNRRLSQEGLIPPDDWLAKAGPLDNTEVKVVVEIKSNQARV